MVDPMLVEQATSLSVDERVADARENPLDGQDWEVARRELRERYGA